MKRNLLFALIFVPVLLSACSSSKSIAEQPGKQQPQNVANPSNEADDDVFPEESVEGWHLLGKPSSIFDGINAEQAYNELLDVRTPKKKVIVAIIDSGIERFHEDLKENIWVNEKEIPGNGKDDDGNGYVDDIFGWNFIGGPDSTHVDKDTYEVTRLYKTLRAEYITQDTIQIIQNRPEEWEEYKMIREDFLKRIAETDEQIGQVEQIQMAYQFAKTIMRIQDLDSVSIDKLMPNDTDTEDIAQAKQILGFFKIQNISPAMIDDELERLNDLRYKSLNPDFNPRSIIGDDYENLSNRYYGNNDVVGPRGLHGTHVAGIVAASRNNGIGADGVASNVQIMILRTVPDGDEHDKDVANAIRYAAENGASIINMSFGKGFSPQKAYVDEAVRFADSLGVLMIHAAGNSAENIDSTANFPDQYYLNNSGYAKNWITVGASGWEGEEYLVAPFSNYGKEKVDVFAPGLDIYSTVIDNEYEFLQGTSMAAPVVSGAAAVLMSYFPELSASEIKEILLETSTKFPDLMVIKPGTEEELVPFSELSRSGGLINLYNAVKRAIERTGN